MNSIDEARRVFDIEISALQKTRDALDDTFSLILNTITDCKGKVIVTGMGKPGHIATKLAATFSSLGTPSFCLHPAEAMHGDLGMISSDDVVLAISYSGESDEIVRIIPNIKLIGAKLIALTANKNSTLAQHSDIVQVLPKFDEACYLGLAPTSSTTAELCYGDALAVVASGIYGFQKSDFGKFHPAGALGKRLILTVDNLMAKGADIPQILEGSLLMDAISEMTKKALGLVTIVDKKKNIAGLITDGDLRRSIQKHIDIYTVKVDEIMNPTPKTIENSKLAVDALKYMKLNSLNNLLVTDGSPKLAGVITLQRIIKAGIVL